jgi:hypothetical protein
MTAEFCISAAAKNALGQFLNLETNFIKHELTDTFQYSPELKQNKDSIYTEQVLKNWREYLGGASTRSISARSIFTRSIPTRNISALSIRSFTIQRVE